MPMMVCLNHEHENDDPNRDPKLGQMFKIERNGVIVVTLASGAPYQIWHSDMWKCPTCGVEVLAGFGRAPVYERHMDGFEQALAQLESGDEKDLIGRPVIMKKVEA